MELDQVGTWTSVNLSTLWTWPSVNLTKLWTWPNVNERPYMWYIFWKAQGQVPSLVKFTPGFNLKVHSMIKFKLGQVPNRANFTIGSNTHLVNFPHGQLPTWSSSFRVKFTLGQVPLGQLHLAARQNHYMDQISNVKGRISDRKSYTNTEEWNMDNMWIFSPALLVRWGNLSSRDSI